MLTCCLFLMIGIFHRVSCTQVLRCALRPAPVSMITEDCISALAEGLSPMLFKHFRKSLWSHECSTPLSSLDFKFDAEWETFSSLIMGWIRNMNSAYLKQEEVKINSGWEFLLCSKMHKNYLKAPCFSGLSLPPALQPSTHSTQTELVSTAVPTEDPSYHKQILMEMLDILHAIYEDYKLDILHSQYVFYPCTRLWILSWIAVRILSSWKRIVAKEDFRVENMDF